MSAALKAECLLLLSAIRRRQTSYSFRLVTLQLKAAGIATSNGWPTLIANVQGLDPLDATVDWSGFRDAIQAVHKHSVLFGKSAAFLFKMGAQPAALAQLQTLVDVSSPLTTSYPVSVSESALKRASFNPVFTRHQTTNSGKHMLVACSKRAFRERESVELSELDAATQLALKEFDQIIGIKRGLVQAFDRIIFEPGARRAVIYIDLCCALNGEELLHLAVIYRDKLNAFASAITGTDGWLDGPINLFPKIAELYNNPEGNVISLGHATGTKSVKDERMRVRSLDLRAEMFHEHGIQAIQNTDAFSIKKGWAAPGRVPNLQIPGHFSMAGTPNAIVQYAILDTCMDQPDFDKLVSKLW